MNNFITAFVFVLALVSTSLFTGCGSAEAIKTYRYPTTKDNLEKAVRKVIKHNPNIQHDSTQEGKLDSIMAKAEREHSVADSALYYNDGKHYVTIKIKVGEAENDYIFRYYGDEQYWNSSSGSAIFIVFAKDKYGNSLSQGRNDQGQFSSKAAKELTQLFQTEFVSKLDEELKLKHTVE